MLLSRLEMSCFANPLQKSELRCIQIMDSIRHDYMRLLHNQLFYDTSVSYLADSHSQDSGHLFLPADFKHISKKGRMWDQ